MPNPRPSPPVVACFGEALWDILPSGIFLGGAPLNVAYHASRLGLRAVPISAVGRDFLGEEALRRIEGWGLPTTFISRLPGVATGTVRATLDELGAATYHITPRVAWDKISVPRALRETESPAALVYGTLALRGKANRSTLMNLFQSWPQTLRVLDLNLREPHDGGPQIGLALSQAQLLKLNDEELGRMVGVSTRSPALLERAARRFSERHRGIDICVTAGSRGAGLLTAGIWHWEKGRRVKVRDTIGAGDSFLAAYLAARLRAKPAEAALASACRMGEFVAGQDGATPPYRVDTRGQPRSVSS